MKKNKPWDENWLVVGPLGSGGHGTVRLVQRRNGQSEQFALKTLNRQHDSERRARMRRETTSIETLRNSGVPRYVECNTADYESSVPLYVVFEYVPGPTLEQLVSKECLDLASAVRMTIALVTTIAYCHDRQIGHRDIKPDNIILRDGVVGEPVLIDFGQSFNSQPEQTALETEIAQQMGNRFLALPELQSPTGTKQDTRSDLTFCCGILYYALTGVIPVTLRNESGLPPHEWATAQETLSHLPTHQRAPLQRLFGQGFRYSVDARWQTADELLHALHTVLNSEPPARSGASGNVLAALDRARDQSEAQTTVRETRAEAAGEALMAFFEPQRDVLLEELERRIDEGIPLEIIREWNNNSTDLSMRELVSMAAEQPGQCAPGVFRIQCKAVGIKGFEIYLECQFEEAEGEHVPVLLSLFFRHSGHKGGQTIRFYFWSDGRLIQAPGGTVQGNEIVRLTLGWIDDEINWSFPE